MYLTQGEISRGCEHYQSELESEADALHFEHIFWLSWDSDGKGVIVKKKITGPQNGLT